MGERTKNFEEITLFWEDVGFKDEIFVDFTVESDSATLIAQIQQPKDFLEILVREKPDL